MGDIGQLANENQYTSADLLIEAQLGHYARLLWDIQKMRIAVGNRKKAILRDGLSNDWTQLHNATLDIFFEQERAVERMLQRLVKRHIMASWIDDCPGLAYGGFARIVGVTGSFLRFPNVAKVWKYMGLHVVDGIRPRRQRGVKMLKTTPEQEGTAFSPQGQVIAHQLGDAIVKVARGKYREKYDERKAKTLARPRYGLSGCPMGQEHKTGGITLSCIKQNADGKETSAHLHNDAMRIAVKELLKDMWVEWHRRGQRQDEDQVSAATLEP